MMSAVAFEGGEAAIRARADQGRERLTLQRLGADALRNLPEAEWDALAVAALVENPFYDRRHVLAGMATLDRGKRVRAYAFRTATGELVGLFLTQPRSKVPAPFPVANSLANDYQFGGTPLIHRDHAEAVAAAWAEQVLRGRLPGLWALADVDTGSATTRLLRSAAEQRGLPWRVVIPYERAYLTRLAGGFEAHLEEVLSKNRLKDVRRTMRRLGEMGALTFEHTEDPQGLAARLEDFLALEHSGWKGAQGTSFLSHAADTGFARAAYVAPFAALDTLLLDGKPIAMKLSIRNGRIAYTPKIAYDEQYRKLGPGMALEYKLLEAFYGDERVEGIDAAATAEGHSALSFFNTHKAMATVIVGRQPWQVNLLAALHEGRKALKTRVKALIAQWKARGTAPAAPAAAEK